MPQKRLLHRCPTTFDSKYWVSAPPPLIDSFALNVNLLPLPGFAENRSSPHERLHLNSNHTVFTEERSGRFFGLLVDYVAPSTNLLRPAEIDKHPLIVSSARILDTADISRTFLLVPVCAGAQLFENRKNPLQ